MTHKPVNAKDLFADLLVAIPEYESRFAQHLADNDELLPYVAMDDFSFFAVENIRSGDKDVLQRCIAFINNAYSSGNEGVQELIRTTFVPTVATLWSNKRQFHSAYDSLAPELQTYVNKWIVALG